MILALDTNPLSGEWNVQVSFQGEDPYPPTSTTKPFIISNTELVETIYIRADGRIDSSSAPILRRDNGLYIFKDPIQGNIVVERNNIILDRQGYTLSGTGIETGIFLQGMSSVELRNMTIHGFTVGIKLLGCDYCQISCNQILDNVNDGIILDDSAYYNDWIKPTIPLANTDILC